MIIRKTTKIPYKLVNLAYSYRLFNEKPMVDLIIRNGTYTLDPTLRVYLQDSSDEEMERFVSGIVGIKRQAWH